MDRSYFSDTLAPLIYVEDKLPLINFLKGMGLLAKELMCDSCGNPMGWRERSEAIDEHAWRCLTKTCSKTWTSIRKGTF